MELRSIIFAFFIVFLPQLSLAAINHGVLVLAPIITASSGLPPEAVGIIGGLSGLGAVWCFAANSKILPCLGPIKTLAFGCLLASFALMCFRWNLDGLALSQRCWWGLVMLYLLQRAA